MLTRVSNALKNTLLRTDATQIAERINLTTDINALTQLTLAEKKVKASNIPLKQTTLRTIQSLLDAYDKTRPATARDIHNALFIESKEKGYPIIQAMLNRGATCTKEDIKFIQSIDEKAAELVSQSSLGRRR